MWRFNERSAATREARITEALLHGLVLQGAHEALGEQNELLRDSNTLLLERCKKLKTEAADWKEHAEIQSGMHKLRELALLNSIARLTIEPKEAGVRPRR